MASRSPIRRRRQTYALTMLASSMPLPSAISCADTVRELAAGLDEHRHAPQLRLGELVLGDRLTEHDTVAGVITRRLVGRLHQTHRLAPRSAIDRSRTLHLEEKPAADAAVEADRFSPGTHHRRRRPRSCACRGSRWCRWPALASCRPVVGRRRSRAPRRVVGHDERRGPRWLVLVGSVRART